MNLKDCLNMLEGLTDAERSQFRIQALADAKSDKPGDIDRAAIRLATRHINEHAAELGKINRTLVEAGVDPKTLDAAAQGRALDSKALGGYAESSESAPGQVSEPKETANSPHAPRQQELVFGPPRKDPIHRAGQAGSRVGASFAQPGGDSTIRMQTTGYIGGKGYTAKTPQEVASLLAPIRKKAQEEVFLVMTDKNGRLLEVERHSRGLRDRSQVDAVQMAGRVYNTPGAEHAYFVHQHPSGDPTPSAKDIQASTRLRHLLQLKNIDLTSMVIGGNHYVDFSAPGAAEKSISPIVRTAQIPVRERVLKPTKYGQKVNNPEAAHDFLKANNLIGREGALLADLHYNVRGVWEYQKGKPTRNLAHELMAAAERHNAVSILPFFKSDIVAPGRLPLLDAIWKVRDVSQL